MVKLCLANSDSKLLTCWVKIDRFSLNVVQMSSFFCLSRNTKIKVSRHVDVAKSKEKNKIHTTKAFVCPLRKLSLIAHSVMMASALL